MPQGFFWALNLSSPSFPCGTRLILPSCSLGRGRTPFFPAVCNTGKQLLGIIARRDSSPKPGGLEVSPRQGFTPAHDGLFFFSRLVYSPKRTS